ncbi:restriction endonuclease subunit S [Cryobacterium sp. Hh11]|uniref:restriction endonuclease subunit S n=1 Tax=Cryobacterium sp. Hh11 TaxID=2555868 RepID=UPI0010692AB4|nr:restriction endonuclease subunit S [Cryobacterium sp. Hh11]TFD54271.1 restriction endonuclease subunit S [Cryobacterium sp. Hh11]
MTHRTTCADNSTPALPWFGKTPKRWRIARFSRSLELITEKATTSDFKVALENIRGWSGEYIDVEGQELAGEGIAFRAGDLLFGKLRPYLAKVWLADRDGAAVGDFHVYRSTAYRGAFLKYLLLNRSYIDLANGSTHGAMMPRASWGFVRSVIQPVPPIEEQRKIADYLDRETGQIDELILKQERLVHTLSERHQALLIHSTHPQKAHWVGRLGRVLRKLERPAIEGAETITAFRDGQVTLRSLRRSEGFTFSETEHGYQGVSPGDLVFHGLDGFAGAVGISNSSGISSPVYHVCSAEGENDVNYIALLLRALGLTGFLTTQAGNVRQRSVDFRNWGTFARLPLSLPAPAEQRHLVEQFSQSSTRTDALIAKAGEMIAVLKERRQALISAAVTGKIDVRGL